MARYASESPRSNSMRSRDDRELRRLAIGRFFEGGEHGREEAVHVDEPIRAAGQHLGPAHLQMAPDELQHRDVQPARLAAELRRRRQLGGDGRVEMSGERRGVGGGEVRQRACQIGLVNAPSGHRRPIV